MTRATLVFIATCCITCVRAQFASNAQTTSDMQGQADINAVLITYNSDFAKKVNPGLYASVASETVLELKNSAEFALTNVKQSSAYALAAYLCFTEPDTDGCEHFNSLGCDAINKDCGAFSSSGKTELASLCTALVDGVKSVEEGCFIVSLRESSDGGPRDEIAPWNHAVQDWVDGHNCTALMYHLKYRCYANLIKWNDVNAEHEYVDLDKLFDSTFGITAVASFNDAEPLECASLTGNDRMTIFEVVEMQVETAVLNFVTTAASLARFGLSSADVTLSMPHMQNKLRTTLLMNLFYDGAVQPFREVCCALNACYDYHPLEVFSDKLDALSTFYRGGFYRLQGATQPFKTMASSGKQVLGSDLDPGYGFTYSVLQEAPAKAVWEAATGADIKSIESF